MRRRTPFQRDVGFSNAPIHFRVYEENKPRRTMCLFAFMYRIGKWFCSLGR